MQREDYFKTDILISDLRQRSIKGAGVSVFSTILNYVIHTIGTFIMARLVTPDDFGLVSIVTVFSTYLMNFGINGFTEALIQEETITHRQVSTLFWVNVSISMLLTVAFMAASPALAYFYSEPRLKGVAVLISFSIILTSLSAHHLALLKRNLRFSIISANEVTCGFISTATAIILAWLGWGYWAIGMRRLLESVSKMAGAWILCRWTPGIPGKLSEVSSILRFAFRTYGNFCITYFGRNVDNILIGKVYGPEPLGFYDRAYQLSSMIPNQVSLPIASVAVATLSRLRGDPEKYRQYFKTMLSMLAFIGMPMGAVFTLTGKDIVLILLGPQWGKAGEIACAFGPGMAMMIVYVSHGWLHLSLGRADKWFKWTIVGSCCSVVLIAGGLSFGTIGVAFAYSLFYYLMTGPALVYAGMPLQLKLSFFLGAIWRYCIAALFSGAACWYLFNMFAPLSAPLQGMHPMPRLALLSVTCGVGYLLATIALFQSTRPITEFVSILRQMLSSR